MPESDPDYIAFDSVDKGSLKMDYPKLLDNLNKHNHPIDDKSIRSMRVFNYIQLSTLLKKKLSDYGNYQSDNPQYREVLSCLRIEQIVFALLLLLNNFLSGFIIKIFNTVKTVNLLLLCNYAGHVILIIAVSFVSIFMMLRANLRRSTVYDKYVFGVLIINMLCSTIATLLSIKVTNAIVCCLIPIIFMGIAIFMNIQLDNVIRKTRREIKLGDDIYG